MTREGFKSVTVTHGAYKLAKERARLEKESIAQIVSKAIERYVYTRRDLEERARLLIKLLDKESSQSSAVRL
jgi:hypothetical protein